MRIGINTIHLVPGGCEEDLFLRHVLPALQQQDTEFSFVVITDPINDDYYSGYETICIQEAARKLRTSHYENLIRRAIIEARIERLLSPLPTTPLKTPVPVVPFVIELPASCVSEHAASIWAEAREKDLRRIVQHAAAGIAPTEYARKRLLEWLGMPLNRCITASPGLDHLVVHQQPSTVDSPYLLLVEPTHPYRNIRRPCEAFERIRNEIPHNLVIVGESGEAEPDNWGEHILRLHRMPAERLAGLYQYAALTICPTPEDSSGLSVLSALYSGAVVLASKSGAVPDIARSAPFYCDMTSVSAIASAIRFALHENESQREHRLRCGRQLASEFTWNKCAQRLAIALRR